MPGVRAIFSVSAHSDSCQIPRATPRTCKDAPMKRLFQLIVGALAIIGGWYAVQQANEHGLTNISLPGLTSAGGNAPPATRGNDTIRLASFNIQVFGESKLNDAA